MCFCLAPRSRSPFGCAPSFLTPHISVANFRSWGKRYFEVDDERGIIYYFRTRAHATVGPERAQEWHEPARHVLLSTLLSARALELGMGALTSHAMEVRYLEAPKAADPGGDDHVPESAPTRRMSKLILRAESEDERQQWLDGLQARIRWQAACAAHGGGFNAPHSKHASPRARGLAPSPTDAAPFTSQSRVEGAPAPNPLPPHPVPANHPLPAASAASAIASATTAARSAAARAESAAIAADICFAMSATQCRSLGYGPSCGAGAAGGGHGGGQTCDANDGGSAVSSAQAVPDLESFLAQRQREVLAALEADGDFQSREESGETLPQQRHAPRDELHVGGHCASARLCAVDDELEPDGIELACQSPRVGTPRLACAGTPAPPLEVAMALSSAERPATDSSTRRLPASASCLADSPVSNEQLQMQMLIAMGATPVIASGTAGAARHCTASAQRVSLESETAREAVAAVSMAWT